MYFEALKIFCDVVRQRSFSRAAAVNRISQSAVSQNVLQLEKGLGVQLIDRSKRPFDLTPQGRAYFEGCKNLVERYYAVEAEVKALGNEVAGEVRVAAIYSVGLAGLSRYVQQFARQYPRATVRTSYLHPDQVVESVVNEDVDLGLISYPKSQRHVIALPWRNETMVLVCHPEHRLAGRSRVTWRDLHGESVVAFDDALRIRQEIDKPLKRHHSEVTIAMAFDNIETIKRAVELGEGVAVLPEPTVRTEVRAKLLTAVPLTDPVISRPLGIIHRKTGQLAPTVRKFIELLQSNGHVAGVNGDGETEDQAGPSGNGNGAARRVSENGEDGRAASSREARPAGVAAQRD
jgi:DNA-binding transcriptional LysR family regulator